MEIITTHKNTDLDAIASVMAAKVLYPDAVPVLPKSINPNAKAFLSIHKDLFKTFTYDKIDPTKVKRLVVTDTNSWNRLGRAGKLKDQKGLKVILWDHHMPGTIEADWKCQEEKGATVTLMLRQIKEKNIKLSPIQATLFLAGIYEDTGRLSFSSTTSEDVYAAAYLLEHKADLSILNKFLRPAYGERQKDILFRMLKNAGRKKVSGFTISCNTVKMDGHVGNLSIVVQMYMEILNVDAAFGIFSDKAKDRCTVIARSNIEDIDVGTIMKSMGGGGHQGAGSAMIKSVKPKAAEEWIMELISGNQRSSVRVGDLMSYPVFSVKPDTTMEKIAMTLREKGCTGLPIVDNGVLKGIISRRDFQKVRKDQMQSPVKAFMSQKNFTITPEKSPMEAARIMVKYDIGRLPVVENEKIIGIITRSDSMRYFYDLLPD